MIENQATHIASQSGAFSPQHTNNWTVEIYGVSGAEVLSLTLQRGFLPTVATEEITAQFGNEQVYFAGRQKFSAGQLTFRDFVDIDTQGILANWYSKVYPGILDANDGRVGQPKDYKRDAMIIVWAPDGTSLRLWKLIGCWPTDFNPGNVDQTSNDQVICGVTLRFDKAVYLGHGENFLSSFEQ